MTNFNPNNIAIENGNIFGFPYSEAEAEIVIIPIPWDVTTSYHKGTSLGPEAILNASYQLDFYHPDVPKPWERKIYLLPIDKSVLNQNNHLNKLSSAYIQKLETGTPLSEKDKNDLAEINAACEKLHENIYNKALDYFNLGKKPVLLGGDHSTPLGLIKAYAEKYNNLSVLQIDAHADLRIAYEGFTYSHASIMHNVLSETNIAKLVQIGIRDICQDEIGYINNDTRITTFFDWDIKNDLFKGTSWDTISDNIVNALTDTIYVSFDIDGLDPKLCPHTGTPVPGGFELAQIDFLLNKIAAAGKKIVGFDLNEVAPDQHNPDNDWDANVGARALFMLCCRLAAM